MDEQQFEEDFYEDNYGNEPDIEESVGDAEEEEETPTDKKIEKKVEEEEEEEIEDVVETANINKNINFVIERKSTPFMTKFEFARLIAVRAKQIEDNFPPHPEVPENLINSLDIAEYELNHEEIPFPFYVLRPVGVPNKKLFERWQTLDLILPKNKITYGL